ncbi:MAG: futalosine hydrolase [Candidatus Desulfofervidaceae bacterium]|nr:futalosine hydrolase [Candidatus Desulfofervidaceae bacterium]
MKELDFFLSKLGPLWQFTLRERRVWQGRWQSFEIIVAETGVGPVNAAHMTTVLLERYPLKLILLVGCAGAFPDIYLKKGDVVLATGEIWAEAGAYTEKGWQSLAEIGLPYWEKGKTQQYNCFLVDRLMIKTLIKIIPEVLPPKVGFKSGLFLTVSATTGNKERLRLMKRRFPEAICENMEGAAIAQVAQIYKVPWVEMRGISNFVGEYDKTKWDIDWAVQNCQRCLINLLARGQEWIPSN